MQALSRIALAGLYAEIFPRGGKFGVRTKRRGGGGGGGSLCGVLHPTLARGGGGLPGAWRGIKLWQTTPPKQTVEEFPWKGMRFTHHHTTTPPHHHTTTPPQQSVEVMWFATIYSIMVDF